jgi:hypothetical protein
MHLDGGSKDEEMDKSESDDVTGDDESDSGSNSAEITQDGKTSEDAGVDEQDDAGDSSSTEEDAVISGNNVVICEWFSQ